MQNHPLLTSHKALYLWDHFYFVCQRKSTLSSSKYFFSQWVYRIPSMRLIYWLIICLFPAATSHHADLFTGTLLCLPRLIFLACLLGPCLLTGMYATDTFLIPCPLLPPFLLLLLENITTALDNCCCNWLLSFIPDCVALGPTVVLSRSFGGKANCSNGKSSRKSSILCSAAVFE